MLGSTFIIRVYSARTIPLDSSSRSAKRQVSMILTRTPEEETKKAYFKLYSSGQVRASTIGRSYWNFFKIRETRSKSFWYGIETRWKSASRSSGALSTKLDCLRECLSAAGLGLESLV